MSRREVERRKFRQALVPGLALSAVAHLALLGLAVLEVPAREESDPNRERQERAEERRDKSLEIVTVRPRPDRAAASDPAGRPSATAAAGAAAPAVGAPSARRVATEPVDVPSVVVAVRREEREDREERLSASDLAALFPGRSETPRPTSRAAREASGDPGTAGDGFRGVAGTQRAGRRGGGCVVRPGTAINRRFPEGITIGGG